MHESWKFSWILDSVIIYKYYFDSTTGGRNSVFGSKEDLLYGVASSSNDRYPTITEVVEEDTI